MNIGISIGIGKGGARRKAFHFYVDSVNGDDGNDGTSAETAFASLGAMQTAALAHGNGVRIGLARNDLASQWDAHWRESLDLSSLDSAKVHGYGDPTKPLPKISCADIASPGAFSLASGQTNTYQITWTHSISNDYTKRKLRVWEDDKPLKWVSSIANCEAEAGTFYAATGSMPNPATIYVHPNGNTNPSSDGKIYEITAREYAVKIGAGYDVRHIHTTKNAHHDGSFGGGPSGYGEGILSTHGIVHNQWVSVGSTHRNCVTYLMEPSTWRTLNGTMFITYDGAGSELETNYIDCWAYSDSPGGNSHTAVYAHASTGKTLAKVAVTGLRAYGPSPGVTAADVPLLELHDSFLEQIASRTTDSMVFGSGATGAASVIRNTTILNGARCFASAIGLDAEDVRVYALAVSGGLVFYGDAKIRNSTFVWPKTVASGNRIPFNSTGAAVEFTDNLTVNAAYRTIRAATAGGVASDGNVFWSEEGESQFAVGGTSYTTLAAWRTATSQDANSAALAWQSGYPVADPANGDFTPTSPVLDADGRQAGSRGHIDRPNWSAMTAAWDAGFIAPVA